MRTIPRADAQLERDVRDVMVMAATARLPFRAVLSLLDGPAQTFAARAGCDVLAARKTICDFLLPKLKR